MKMTMFNAVCPIEIGDEIFIIGGKAYYLLPGIKIPQKFWYTLCTQAERRKIEDIATVMYCESGNVEFHYRLNGEQEYKKLDVVAVASILR